MGKAVLEKKNLKSIVCVCYIVNCFERFLKFSQASLIALLLTLNKMRTHTYTYTLHECVLFLFETEDIFSRNSFTMEWEKSSMWCKWWDKRRHLSKKKKNLRRSYARRTFLLLWFQASSSDDDNENKGKKERETPDIINYSFVTLQYLWHQPLLSSRDS